MNENSIPAITEPVIVPNLGRILLQLAEELRGIYPQVKSVSIVGSLDDGRMIVLPVM